MKESSKTGPYCTVFLVRAPKIVNTAHFAHLSVEEQSTCGRLRNEEHRARFTCAHALLRLSLAARLDIATRDLNLQAGANRRPELAPELARQHPGVDFNLSTTPGYAACAIGQGVRVGIDIELVRSGPTVAQLKDQVLSRREQDWLEHSNDPAGFFKLWTLKEAVAKADGEGLGLAFNELETLPLEDGNLDLDLRRLAQANRRWRVIALRSVVPAALAITGPVIDADILINEAMPASFRAVHVSIGAQGRAG